MTYSQKFYGLIGIIAGLAFLYAVFVLGFLWGQIQHNIQALNSVRKEHVKNEAQREALEEFKKIERAAGLNFKQIDQLFINKDVPYDFVLFLENLAKGNELSMELSGGGSGGSKKDPWDELTFQVTLEGQIPDALQFIAQLEKSPYLIDIQNIQISAISKSSGAGNGVFIPGINRVYLSFKIAAK